MSAGASKPGRLFLLQIGDGGGSEVFTTIGGIKAASIKLNAEQIDVTDMASNDWKELLANYGIRTVSISGSGVFKNDTFEQLIRTKFLALASWNYKLIDADSHYYQGAFMIKSLEYKGSDKDAETYSITLESNGAVTFT